MEEEMKKESETAGDSSQRGGPVAGQVSANGVGGESADSGIAKDEVRVKDLDGKAASVGLANDRTGGGQGSGMNGEESGDGVGNQAVNLTVGSEGKDGKTADDEFKGGKVPKGEKGASYVIDMNWDGGEKVCRICHLSSEGSIEAVTVAQGVTVTSMELIQLGCGCKDELGVAHSHCGEAWFKLKGNRVCEICGETAKNITGVVTADNITFMEEWNQLRLINGGANPPERGGGCWRGQPFCNFLMACLVIAFVLPWFFRVNMF